MAIALSPSWSMGGGSASTWKNGKFCQSMRNLWQQWRGVIKNPAL